MSDFAHGLDPQGGPRIAEIPPISPAAPSFVGCCGRSGSTLLRWLIDTHPEIACPGETDLAVLMSAYVKIATDLAEGVSGARPPRVQARLIADELMEPYLVRAGKSRWCDKSLSNVFHLDLLASIWPDARFVLLHRHCMDFVMNGIEVSPWGLAEYGFAQVAQMSPTDSVVALAAYWVDRTQRLLAFEAQHPDRCLRLKYEDLVGDTDAVLASLWRFLGVREVEGIAAAAFQTEHSTFGAADHEIWYTTGIHHGSIGRGARIPPDHLAGPLRTSANGLLGALGYATVDDDWGSGVLPLRRAHARDGSAISSLADLRVVEGHQVLWQGVVDLAKKPPTRPLGLREAEEAADFVVAVERVALTGLAERNENIGVALRSRIVRPYGPLPRYFKDEREVFEHLLGFLHEHGAQLLSESANGAAGRASE